MLTLLLLELFLCFLLLLLELFPCFVIFDLLFRFLLVLDFLLPRCFFFLFGRLVLFGLVCLFLHLLLLFGLFRLSLLLGFLRLSRLSLLALQLLRRLFVILLFLLCHFFDVFFLETFCVLLLLLLFLLLLFSEVFFLETFFVVPVLFDLFLCELLRLLRLDLFFQGCSCCLFLGFGLFLFNTQFLLLGLLVLNFLVFLLLLFLDFELFLLSSFGCRLQLGCFLVLVLIYRRCIVIKHRANGLTSTRTSACLVLFSRVYLLCRGLLFLFIGLRCTSVEAF
mmetsp:Transcript_73158/g.118698  ORF Transcript_73158/g.118698 Transcript_73158/m.118698 type:complete len:279 (-) Transcript_73158:1755-2591(-)